MDAAVVEYYQISRICFVAAGLLASFAGLVVSAYYVKQAGRVGKTDKGDAFMAAAFIALIVSVVAFAFAAYWLPSALEPAGALKYMDEQNSYPMWVR